MTETELPPLVLPGDYLGAAEEYLPGRGTYEDRGRIYASVLGTPSIDARDRTVRVEARNAVPELMEGDIVYALVDELKSAMAICTILTTTTSKRAVPGHPEGTVHISKAKDGYTETLSGEFAVGDILLAKVLQAGSSIKLTTAPTSLGVVSARCQACHAVMRLGGSELVCPRCGHHEKRKLAKGPHRAGSDAHAPDPR
ncbi:MAG: exosome complex RNA-binding protein Csl4 [Thermoplasmata archaeon]